MDNCKHLDVKDITPFQGDVFDHPNYEHICKLTGREVVTYIQCNNSRCKSYESSGD